MENTQVYDLDPHNTMAHENEIAFIEKEVYKMHCYACRIVVREEDELKRLIIRDILEFSPGDAFTVRKQFRVHIRRPLEKSLQGAHSYELTKIHKR